MAKKIVRKRRPKIDRAPKVCRLCEGKVKYVDFKDAEFLKRFQTEKGRIMPRRITGTCMNHQKMLTEAIKRARVIGLVC